MSTNKILEYDLISNVLIIHKNGNLIYALDRDVTDISDIDLNSAMDPQREASSLTALSVLATSEFKSQVNILEMQHKLYVFNQYEEYLVVVVLKDEQYKTFASYIVKTLIDELLPVISNELNPSAMDTEILLKVQKMANKIIFDEMKLESIDKLYKNYINDDKFISFQVFSTPQQELLISKSRTDINELELSITYYYLSKLIIYSLKRLWGEEEAVKEIRLLSDKNFVEVKFIPFKRSFVFLAYKNPLLEPIESRKKIAFSQENVSPKLINMIENEIDFESITLCDFNENILLRKSLLTSEFPISEIIASWINSRQFIKKMELGNLWVLIASSCSGKQVVLYDLGDMILTIDLLQELPSSKIIHIGKKINNTIKSLV